MDVNTIFNLIGNIGFPIICVVFMWKYISTTLKEFSDKMEQHTVTLEKLCTKLDMIVEGKENDRN